ncbi:MAG TPA: hypothetical protein VMW51_06410 [Terriglobia bacterium]|nr:hypothetical protein [Terriglobia bacterium]
MGPGESGTRRLPTEKEQQQVRLEEAVDSFLADQIVRLGDNSTVRNSQSLFGYSDPESRTVTRDGRRYRRFLALWAHPDRFHSLEL